MYLNNQDQLPSFDNCKGYSPNQQKNRQTDPNEIITYLHTRMLKISKIQKCQCCQLCIFEFFYNEHILSYLIDQKVNFCTILCRFQTLIAVNRFYLMSVTLSNIYLENLHCNISKIYVFIFVRSHWFPHRKNRIMEKLDRWNVLLSYVVEFHFLIESCDYDRIVFFHVTVFSVHKDNELW